MCIGKTGQGNGDNVGRSVSHWQVVMVPIDAESLQVAWGMGKHLVRECAWFLVDNN